MCPAGSMGGGAVTSLDGLGEWLATLLIASIAWAASILPLDVPNASIMAPPDEQPQRILSWAQSDQPIIEQVGEGTATDDETLDNGAPPATTSADQETLDNGSLPPAEQVGDDVELLDQGAPASATLPIATAPDSDATTYVVPVAETTYAAPVAYGPVVPAGFGTGNVYAVAGHSGVPVGVEGCHVGAVTGRAYAAIDCGEGATFVGHAPTFQDFPFVLEASFPFDGDEAFFTEGSNFPFGPNEILVPADRNSDDGADVVVSNTQNVPERRNDETSTSVSGRPGATSVQFAQRSREREPRVRLENRASNNANNANNASNAKDSGKKQSNGNSNGNGSAQRASADSVSAQSVQEDRGKGKKQQARANAKNKKKQANHGKQRGERKKNKNRNGRATNESA